MAKKNDLWGILIIGAIILVAAGVINLPGLGQSSIGTQGGTGGTGGNQGGGLLTSNPSLNFTVIDAKTGGVVPPATVELLGANDSLVTTGNTSAGVVALSNLDPNTDYTALVKIASGTASIYTQKFPVKTNAAGSKTYTLAVLAETATAPTVTVYSNDGITANSYTSPQAIAANDQVTYRIRVRPAASANDNNGFGDGQNPFIIAVDYNTTAFNQLSMKDGSTVLGSGKGAIGHTVYDANQNSTQYFESVSKRLNPATDYDFYLTVKSGSQNPVAASGEIYVTFYDQCLVKNSLTGKYEAAPTDPVDGSAICSSNAVSSVYYS